MKLRLEVLAVKYPLWDMARIGPDGLERVAQADTLKDGLDVLLESTLAIAFTDHSHVRLIVELDVPEE